MLSQSEFGIRPCNVSRSPTHENKSDLEMEIILDTRIINEIDNSKAALQNISKRLEEKKNVLLERTKDG